MTLKYINYSVDMYGTSAITTNTYQTVFTGDEDSVQLKFSITDEEDLTGATALIHLYFGDSSHFERTCTPITGGFQYTLTGTENDHAGVTRVDIYITKAGAKFTRAGYKFRIDKSLEASAPLVEYAVETVDTVVKEAGYWLLQAQTDFGTAQDTRAAEWVTDNDTRADEFTAAQTSRATTFGESEASRASTFNTNETGRSNTFTTNENARQAAAEANQAQAATDHTTAEADHDIAIADSSMASSDHATATTDHSTAVIDHSTASADHTAALADQEIVDGLQDQFNDVIANATVDSEVINARQGSATLSQNLLSIKSELADIDSGKVDKNGSGQVGWANIAQDARLQIIGTTPPAVVGVDSVLETNIANKAVSTIKLDTHLQHQLGEYALQPLTFVDRTYYDATTFAIVAKEGNARFEPIPINYGDIIIIDELYDGKLVYLDNTQTGIALIYSGDVTTEKIIVVDNPTAAYIGISCFFGGKDLLTVKKYNRFDISDAAAKVALIDDLTKLDVTSVTVPANHLSSNVSGTYTRESLTEGVKFTIQNTSPDTVYEIQIGDWVAPVYERLAYFAADYEVVSVTAPFTMTQSNYPGVGFDTSVGAHTYLNRASSIVVQFKMIINVPAGATVVILFKHLNVFYQTNDTSNTHLTDNLVDYVIDKHGYTAGTYTILKPMSAYYADLAKLAETATKIISKWAGKKWVSYGDSITGQGGWQEILVSRFGLVHTNLGIGGTTAAGTDANAGWQDVRINAFPAGTEVITIMFGTNDQSQNMPIGSDDGDTTTYTGALGVIVRKLQTMFPDARIIIMAPPFRTDSVWDADPAIIPYKLGDSRDMDLYATAAKGIANKYGATFVDMWAELGINVINFKNYLSNETWPVHLNDAGKKRFASTMIDVFSKIEPID